MNDGDLKTFSAYDSPITAVRQALHLNYDNFEDLTYSPDGKWLASAHMDSRILLGREGGYNGGINLWNTESLEHEAVLTGHKVDVTEVEFTPDSKFLVSASEDHSIRVWDIDERKEQLKIQDEPRFYYTVEMIPPGKAFLAGSSQRIRPAVGFLRWLFRSWSEDYLQLRDMQSGKILRKFRGPRDSVTDVALAPDGKHFVSGDLDGTVRLWDLLSGKQKSFLYQVPRGYIIDLSYSKDGKRLAVGHDSGVKIIEVDTKRPILSLEGPYRSVEFLAGDLHLLAYGAAQFSIWNIEEKKTVLDVRREEIGGLVQAHAVSPDGKKLALGFTEDKTKTQRIILLDLRL